MFYGGRSRLILTQFLRACQLLRYPRGNGSTAHKSLTALPLDDLWDARNIAPLDALWESPWPKKAALQRTLDVMILKALSWRPLHGYGVTRRLPVGSIATLALGIGAIVAIYRLVDAVVLRPLVAARMDAMRVLRQD
jgi:hypothetical protein